MPDGGVLTVALSAEGGNLARISIRDTGVGLDPREAARLFEPFQSRFAGGTGLGLAIVYQILQAHRGRIRVESGKGTARNSSSSCHARVSFARRCKACVSSRIRDRRRIARPGGEGIASHGPVADRRRRALDLRTARNQLPQAGPQSGSGHERRSGEAPPRLADVRHRGLRHLHAGYGWRRIAALLPGKFRPPRFSF